MTVERLDRKDGRLLVVCAVIAAVSLFIGVRYFFLAFPEASIEFRVTKDSSRPVAEAFAAKAGVETSGYRHAAVFGYDDDAKTFLERELGVEESGRLLDSTIRLWRWEHRWFRPLQKEEIRVEVTTKGEPVGFDHLLAEEAEGASLAEAEARSAAEEFLVKTMSRPLDTLAFVEGSQQKRPHRVDHLFTWRVKGSEVRSGAGSPADYRIAVGVGGDRVTAYHEFLKIPEEWKDSYDELRSRNLTAGAIDAVFLLLTGLALLAVLVLRIRKRDVRFGTAGVLGFVTFALVTISNLNALPVEFYGYDTTSSFAGFLSAQILRAVAQGLGYGAIIFLLTAGAEPVYRDRFPKVLSLTSLLRARAYATKELFIGTAVGLTLTCFFFAYENVFYIIANRLGAWAPREVNYSDLLSTVFPWVYVLFFGWFPAISEEFSSRMFSIPFLEKILRTRTGAILIAAAIWGFGHAAYPNQPFWIRGLEVGLAGVVFGLVFLRFGITAVVITHFSVDALYTAFVMIRSESLYYRLTGSVSAGIFGVLFVLMVIGYLRRGGFRLPEVTNEKEDELLPPEPMDAPAQATVPAGSVFAPGGPTAAGGLEARPLGGTRIAAGLAIAAGLVAVSLVPIERFGDWIDFAVTKPRAIASAETFLRGAGFDVSKYRRAAMTMDRTDPTAAAYLLENGGLEAARETYRVRVPTPLWRARFFIPSQKEEYAASIDPATGAVLGFSRDLPEDAPGATLPPAEALRIAEAFVRARGQDPSAGVLKEQTAKDEKARRDHTFVWDYSYPDMGEATVRYEVVVQGDRVGSWTRGVKIPEEWERRHEETTALKVLFRFLKIPVIGLVAGFALFALIMTIRQGDLPWKIALAAAGIGFAANAVRTVLGLDVAWVDQYKTSFPAPTWRVILGISVIVAGMIGFVLAALFAAIVASLFPHVRGMFSAARRRRLAKDALIAGVIALGFRLGLPVLGALAARLVPSGLLVSGIPIPSALNARIPFLSSIADTSFWGAMIIPGAVAIVLGVVAIHFRSALARTVMAALFVLSFLPGGVTRPPEAVAGAIALIVNVGGVALLAIAFLRDNPLAWVWSGWFAVGIDFALGLISQSGSTYRQNGVVALILVLLPGLVLVRDAFSGPAPLAMIAPATTAPPPPELGERPPVA